MLFAWICILATTLAINTIFVMTLFAGLSWGERAVIMFATAAIAAGILFTLRSVRALSMPALSTPKAAAPSHHE